MQLENNIHASHVTKDYVKFCHTCTIIHSSPLPAIPTSRPQQAPHLYISSSPPTTLSTTIAAPPASPPPINLCPQRPFAISAPPAVHALPASPNECHNIPYIQNRVHVPVLWFPLLPLSPPSLTTMFRRLDSPVAPDAGWVVEQRAGVSCYLPDSSITTTRRSVLIPTHRDWLCE